MTTRSGWPLPAIAMGLAALASALLSGWIVSLHGTGEEALGLLNRSLVRLSLPMFLAAFTASALQTFLHNDVTRVLLRERRAIGLAYATVHFAHGIAIVAMFELTSAEPTLDVGMIGGGLGFVFVALMAATSNDASVRALGRKRWSRLHTIGIHYLWFIYAFTYFGRLAGDGGAEFWPGMTLILAALALRVAATLHRRRARTAPLVGSS